MHPLREKCCWSRTTSCQIKRAKTVLNYSPSATLTTMKAIDLFTGIGAMSVALHPLGFTPVMYCDIEPASRITLTALMKNGKLPTAPIHDDIRTLKAPPKADLVTAGFPCLGFSPLGIVRGSKIPNRT